MVDTNQLNQVLKQIPNFVFWKDKNSVFLGCNQYFAKIAGVNCTDHIKGMTDADMPWKKTHAHLYRKRDMEILNGAIDKNRIETQLQASGRLVKVMVNKTQLLSNEGEIIGVVGSFIEMPDILDAPIANTISLPKSQKAVLMGVVRGLSAKQIAVKMHLSTRTIEYYIHILKKKFLCRTKSELIAKVYQSNLIPNYTRSVSFLGV